MIIQSKADEGDRLDDLFNFLSLFEENNNDEEGIRWSRGHGGGRCSFYTKPPLSRMFVQMKPQG